PAPAVAELRALLRRADGFIISVPEYAHGLPGAFKNALDWLVSSGELAKKPILVLNASAGGQYAQANLVETLTLIEGEVLEALLLAPFVRTRLTADGALGEAESTALAVAVTALLAAIVAAA